MSSAAPPAWALIARARREAGISQQELARRAGTSQSAIARYERARVTPDLPTLHRLIRACGLELRYHLHPVDDGDALALEESLRLSPAERLEQNRRFTALGAAAQAARDRGAVRRMVPGA